MESIANLIEWLSFVIMCLFDYILRVLRGTAYVLMAALIYACFSPPPNAPEAITLAGVIATVKIVFPLVAVIVIAVAASGLWRIGPDKPPLLFWRKP